MDKRRREVPDDLLVGQMLLYALHILEHSRQLAPYAISWWPCHGALARNKVKRDEKCKKKTKKGTQNSELGRRERICVFTSPTRKYFDDAKREDAPLLKTMRSQKPRQVTDAKFCVTGDSDIS